MLIYLTSHSAYTVIYLPVRQVQQKYTVFIPFVLPNKNVKHNQRSTNNMPKNCNSCWDVKLGIVRSGIFSLSEVVLYTCMCLFASLSLLYFTVTSFPSFFYSFPSSLSDYVSLSCTQLIQPTLQSTFPPCLSFC